MPVGSIKCGLPLWNVSAKEQTCCSIGLRITAVFLGVIALSIGVLAFIGLPELYRVGTTARWLLTSMGGVSLIVGLCVGYAPNKKIENSVNKKNESPSTQTFSHQSGTSYEAELKIAQDSPHVSSIEPKTKRKQIEVPSPEIDKNILLKKYPKPQPGPVKNGYGEYIVYRNGTKGREIIDEEMYNKTFDIFEQHRPQAIAKETTRHRFLQARVKEIDPALEIAFVPNVLYSLFYMRQCVQEDLDQGRLCNIKHVESERDESIEGATADHDFWQTCFFSTEEKSIGDDSRVREIAFKLNEIILRSFENKKTEEGCFLFEDLQKTTDEHIEFFKNIHEESKSEVSKRIWPDAPNQPFIGRAQWPGLTSIMSTESEKNHLRPCGIYKPRHVEIVKTALELECSTLTDNSVILYRGSVFSSDSLVKKGHANSLSLGTGLFDATSYDPEASFFYYGRQDKLDAQAIIVSLSEIDRSPFSISLQHPIRKICSRGELFHPRTKIWNLEPDDQVNGFWKKTTQYCNLDASVKTDQSAEEVQNAYWEYKAKHTILLV